MVDAAPGKSCGSCTLCCKVLTIEELQKPDGIYCSNCKVGVGCGIYAERPVECRNFMCAWIYSPLMGPQLKPEITHVVIWEWVAGRCVLADCDPDYPDAWHAPAVINFLRQTAKKLPSGWKVVAKLGQQTWRVTQDAIWSETGEVSSFVDHRVMPIWRGAMALR
ncbi:MAG TPA: hypothetical protein VIY51_09265 [Xanthobacteraceae bacterium]